MFEKWKKGKAKVLGALLTGLSKACDCLDHKLLTAKLHAYSFNLLFYLVLHTVQY